MPRAVRSRSPSASVAISAGRLGDVARQRVVVGQRDHVGGEVGRAKRDRALSRVEGDARRDDRAVLLHDRRGRGRPELVRGVVDGVGAAVEQHLGRDREVVAVRVVDLGNRGVEPELDADRVDAAHERGQGDDLRPALALVDVEARRGVDRDLVVVRELDHEAGHRLDRPAAQVDPPPAGAERLPGIAERPVVLFGGLRAAPEVVLLRNARHRAVGVDLGRCPFEHPGQGDVVDGVRPKAHLAIAGGGQVHAASLDLGLPTKGGFVEEVDVLHAEGRAGRLDLPDLAPNPPTASTHARTRAPCVITRGARKRLIHGGDPFKG
jgi:hypothetical protein